MGEIRPEAFAVEGHDGQYDEAKMVLARLRVARKLASYRESGKAESPVILWDNPYELCAFKRLQDREYTYEQAVADWQSDTSVRTSTAEDIAAAAEAVTDEPELGTALGQSVASTSERIEAVLKDGKLVDARTGEEVN